MQPSRGTKRKLGEVTCSDVKILAILHHLGDLDAECVIAILVVVA